MVRDEIPPKDQESAVARVLVIPVLLTAAVTVGTASLVTESARIPLICYGVAATVVVAWYARALHRRAAAARAVHEGYARRIARLERRLTEQDEATVRLGKELMPVAVHRLRQGESPAEVMRAVVDGDERYRGLPDAQRSLLLSVLDLADDEDAMRESAQRAFVNIARRVQAIVHQQASELRAMEEAHGRNPEVFDDLLRIDHGTALIGRLADSITVLGKARPSRQWPKPVPLFSVLRGAMSRILEYQRVDLHSIAKVAVVGTAVEPLIHACAELLDNATRYSPPQTRVHVTAVEVQTGIAIEIEDGGVSLSEEARRRAERMLAQAQLGLGLKDLGDTPRLGMAVVGRLCQMHNLQVSLRQSAYGGVRAVLIVPHDIITTGPAPGIAHGIGAAALPRAADDLPTKDVLRPANRKPRPVTGPRRTVPLPAGMDDDVPVVTEWTENGLPQRRSRGRAPLGSHNLGAARYGAGSSSSEWQGGSSDVGHRGDTRGPTAAGGPAAGSVNGHASAGPDRLNGNETGRVRGPDHGDGTAAGTTGPVPPGAGSMTGAGFQAPDGRPGPGIWLEAFTKAVNGTPHEPSTGTPSTGTGEVAGQPGDQGDSDDTWGKGDLK
ncbi:sensor histidine kinase [Streptomyces sp. NRRL F-5135]|uniref:sensor histidine kinase n=1 Tax=Streptomyces sp. NRRL F-5135 TaxID=1463858 RepID=UPI000AACD17D|nr:ATP-binding protein [Streptomyces sp. NRRL F-5135]